MAITTEQIKELREATGVGILACREALQQADGDFDKAVDYLRQKGLAKAAKRSGREAAEGTVKLYSHGEGRIGVMVEVNCETDFVARSEGFQELAHEISLQIAAMSPVCVSEDELSEEMLERERAVAINRAKEEGKPDNILDKIAEGSLKKYKQEVVLMNQAYIRDEDQTIQDLISAAVSALGENIVVRRFARWELGEHTDEEDSDE